MFGEPSRAVLSAQECGLLLLRSTRLCELLLPWTLLPRAAVAATATTATAAPAGISLAPSQPLSPLVATAAAPSGAETALLCIGAPSLMPATGAFLRSRWRLSLTGFASDVHAGEPTGTAGASQPLVLPLDAVSCSTAENSTLGAPPRPCTATSGGAAATREATPWAPRAEGPSECVLKRDRGLAGPQK